jgi:AsmA protein
MTYSNIRSSRSFALDDIDAVIDFTKLNKPAQAQGAFAFANRRVIFKALAATPELLMQEHVSEIDLTLTSELARAGFKGTIDPSGVLSGIARIDTSSVRAAGTWLGAHLPESGGFGALSLQSRIDGDDQNIHFSDMTLTLDGMKAAGAVALDTSHTIPYASGALTLDHLDLNPYIERPHKLGAPHGRPDNERWSNAPITLDLLKKANADLTLDVGTLVLRKLQLGKTRLAVALHDAQLNARLDPVALYGGSGKAILRVDARKTPFFQNTVDFDRVSLQPFLSDTIGVKQIEGAGTITLDATSRGTSTNAIMHNLTGKGSIDFHDGQLRGIDLGAVARTIQALLGGAIHSDAFTTYKTMSGNFTLANGVLTNTDFQLTGPVLQMTGSGAVDIGSRAIDFRLVPQASAVIAKQKFSVGLPFRIKGPWKHVHYTPDVTGIVGGVLDNLKNGRAPFKNLFGGSKAPKDPNASKKKHKNIGDALKNMLGIH